MGSKGGTFERLAAKALSRWLTDGEDPKQLIRSVQSGGWTGNHGDGAWRQVGDLAPNGDAGAVFRKHFGIECKHRWSIDFWWHWTQKPGKDNIAGWWIKLCGEIDALSMAGAPAPLLIIRANNRPILAGTVAALLGRPEYMLTLSRPTTPVLGLIPLDEFCETSPETYYARVEEHWWSMRA